MKKRRGVDVKSLKWGGRKEWKLSKSILLLIKHLKSISKFDVRIEIEIENKFRRWLWNCETENQFLSPWDGIESE